MPSGPKLRRVLGVIIVAIVVLLGLAIRSVREGRPRSAAEVAVPAARVESRSVERCAGDEGGALAIEIDAVGDEALGAVIDAVEFPAANTIVDGELLECIRESALTMSLPPPAQGGRTGFMITLDVDGAAE